MNCFTRALWSPYVAGAGIGILSWFAFLTAGRPLGISTSYVRLAAWVEGLVVPSHAAGVPYLAKLSPVFDWEFFLVVGVAIGGWAASRLSKAAPAERPAGGRIAEAVLGGFFLLVGARLANGCTSGNGISGSLQLALSGWVFFITMFVSGLITALLFKKEAR